MAAEKIPLDKLGNSLLSLKDNSVKLDNINRFVRQNKTYNYIKGRLNLVGTNV